MLRSYTCPTATRPEGEVPIRIRVGDGDEHEIGSITEATQLPDFLRAVAEYWDSQTTRD